MAGPTAVGKTALSVRLAEQLKTEIISADSRQFFRELAIGTAKPSPEELGRVRHHFIDSHSIREAYSAGDFERDALRLLNELFRAHDAVIMTGGSGLYLRAVCEGLDDLPQPLPGLRQALMKRLETEGLGLLQEEAGQVDPVFSLTAEIHNPQRVVRALEVYHTTGRPLSSFRTNQKSPRPFRQIQVALYRDRPELYERVNRRMDAMLGEGLVEEARSVAPYRQHHALQTVGYKEVYGYLDGEYDEAEMIRLLKQNSRRYAKRQLTWFRHQGNYRWFHADDEEGILAHIRAEMTTPGQLP